MSCGVVADANVPIEIRPGTKRGTVVYWQVSTDHWEHPTHFVLGDHQQHRPLRGKYRFALGYSLEPWTVFHRPLSTYVLTSPEFLAGSE
jgi:hypothetical protein